MLQTMTVVRDDFTFANWTRVKNLKYGNAADCYTNRATCGPIGTFRINTLGTGMKFSDGVCMDYLISIYRVGCTDNVCISISNPCVGVMSTLFSYKQLSHQHIHFYSLLSVLSHAFTDSPPPSILHMPSSLPCTSPTVTPRRPPCQVPLHKTKATNLYTREIR